MSGKGIWKGSEMAASEVRKYMEAAFEKLTPAKAQEMARSVVQGGGREQVQKLAHDLMEWSTKSRRQLSELVDRQVGEQLKRNRERLAELIDHQVKEQFKRSSAKLTEAVQREVRRQVQALGVATRDDLDALKRRVRQLERGGAPERSTARKRVAKKAPAQKTVAKRSGTPSTS